MIYAGIGARETPPVILKAMEASAKFLAIWDHTLRSGGAYGADSAFEWGCKQKNGTKEIYLPYRNFAGNTSPLFGSDINARNLTKQFHPCWANVGCAGREFMARNAYQILGPGLNNPVDFVICWTPNGKTIGGTGQAIRIAEHYRIPIFNLGSMSTDEANEGIANLLIS